MLQETQKVHHLMLPSPIPQEFGPNQLADQGSEFAVHKAGSQYFSWVYQSSP
jgi:hypothetical protein